MLSTFLADAVLKEYLVVDLGAAFAGICDAGADLDGFDGVDRHNGTGDAAVEFVFPGCVRAEADGQAFCHDLENAAERVAVGFGLVDKGDHLHLAFCVGTVERGIGRDRGDLFPSLFERNDLDMSELNNMTLYLDAEGGEKLFGDGTAGDAGGGFAGRSTFENVAQVAGPIFLPAGKIGVAGTRTRLPAADCRARFREPRPTSHPANGRNPCS